MVQITLCMGSSCFSRGNSANLTAIKTWLAEHYRDANVTLKGCRCGGKCGEGPNVWLNDTCHSGVAPDNIPALLATLFADEA